MRLRTGLLLAGVLTTVLFTSAFLGGSSSEVPTEDGRDAHVTDDTALTRTHEASDLLLDSDDPDVAYLSAVELQTGDCRLYRSADRGGSWSAVESTVDSPLEQEDPDVAPEPAPEVDPFVNCGPGSVTAQNIRTELSQAPDGTLYYVFHAHDPDAGGSRSVLVARSSDEGQTWETTVVAEGPVAQGPEEDELNFQAHLAIDPEDQERVLVMWRRSFNNPDDGPSSPTRPWMAWSDDGGETFDEPVMMFDDNPGFDGPRPIFHDGRLHAFYRVSAPPSDDDEPPNRTRVVAAASTDEGQTWEETDIAAELDASEPIPVYDPTHDAFFVVWHDNRNGDLDAFFSRSDDGQDWTEPQRLNDDEIGNRIGQYYPQIAVSPGGRIDVAWYDYRDDPSPPPAEPEDGSPLGLGSNLGDIQAVYVTSSLDGGDTWSDNLRVNDVSIDRTVGTWNSQFFWVVPLSVAAWDDRTLVSWSDTRNATSSTETQDIYASVVRVADAPSSMAPIALFGVAALLFGAAIALLVVKLWLRRSRPEPAPGAAAA